MKMILTTEEEIKQIGAAAYASGMTLEEYTDLFIECFTPRDIKIYQKGEKSNDFNQ